MDAEAGGRPKSVPNQWLDKCSNGLRDPKALDSKETIAPMSWGTQKCLRQQRNRCSDGLRAPKNALVSRETDAPMD